MAKKRKQTPQSSTLHDFFGKTPSGTDLPDAKKSKTIRSSAQNRLRSSNAVVAPQDIIVIDSDSDDVVVTSGPRPGIKPLQIVESDPLSLGREGPTAQGTVTILGDISALARPSRRIFEADVLVKGPNVKTEPGGSQNDALLGEATPPEPALSESREPSLFGFPDLLVPGNVESEASTEASRPPCPHDCSHDGEGHDNARCVAATLDEDAIKLGPGGTLASTDWGTGDDEIEFGEIEIRVKNEASEEVDIDLTLEVDEDPDVSSDSPVETCPICERQLVGMTTLQIHEHVDGCIDALPDPKPPEPSPSAPWSSKAPRPLSALPAPQLPADEEVKPSVKQESGEGNVFATLMTSYKENEAWKEASAVEDRNFRPTKANGGRRKAPFYKVLQGMPIAVDAFRYGAIPNVTAYFLTHAHSDHYTNLSANWKNGPIYCSQGTANLIIHMLGVDPKWVHPLPMDVPTTVPNTGGVQVTLIEANHCPGSCLFLFEGKQTVNAGDSAYKSPFVGSARVFRYLHCGDFRASPQHVLHPAIKGKRIDHVYLDTTYLDPKYCFPPQPLVISACADLAKRLVQGRAVEEVVEGKKPRTVTGWFTRQPKDDKGKEEKATSPGKVLVVVGTYSIGKERIVKAIAKALDTKVYCDSRKAAILRCQNDPELDALLTADALSAGVHLVPLGVIASDRLKDYADRWKGHYSKVVGFRPTGWTYTQPNGSDTLPSIPAVISRSQNRTFTHANLSPMRNSTATLQVYGVPYSEHSSFFELTCFALSLDWGRMIATVNVGSETSRGKMAKWVERWEAERKKRGGAKIVDYRAEDYW